MFVSTCFHILKCWFSFLHNYLQNFNQQHSWRWFQNQRHAESSLRHMMRHYSKQETLLLKGQLHFFSERVNMYPVKFLIVQIFVLSNLLIIQTLRNDRFKFQMKTRFQSTKFLIDISAYFAQEIKLFFKKHASITSVVVYFW